MDKTIIYKKYIHQLIIDTKVTSDYMSILLNVLDDKDFQSEEDKHEIVDKLIMTIVLMDKNTLDSMNLSSDKLKCNVQFIKAYITKWNTCEILYFCDKLKANEELILLAVSKKLTNIQSFNINIVSNLLLLQLLDINFTLYDLFPHEIKTSRNKMFYILHHSPHRTSLRVHTTLLNDNKFIFDLSKFVSSSDILKICINGEKTFLFAIQDKLIDAKFKSHKLTVFIESLDHPERDNCIRLIIEKPNLEIDLHSYYYDTDAFYCPHISHDDFFIILDTISSIYHYTTTLYDASRKLITSDGAVISNPHKDKHCTLLGCIMSLANGSIERGQRKGYDEWSGTFYSQYGFKNDLYNQFMQTHQPKLLSEYNTQLYTMLDTIIKQYKMPIDVTTVTLQDCAKLIIQFCKQKNKMGIFIQFIDLFSRIIYHEISDMRKFTKSASTQKYSIELLEHNSIIVFNIKKMSGGKQRKKTKKYIKRAV
jgi:hypothetical protein